MNCLPDFPNCNRSRHSVHPHGKIPAVIFMQPSHRAIWPAILLALIVLGTALRPGDAPWIFDEPLLMNGALFYNAKPCRLGPIFLPFTPAVTGLQGTRGVRYGPLAVWI